MTLIGRTAAYQRPVLCVAAMLVSACLALAAQSLTVRADGNALRVNARGFGFIEGEILGHLRDGRSVRVELVLAALASAGGPTVSERRQTFNLSFDLWEERFAVTHVGQPPRSVSHLQREDAEVWCVENIWLPLDDLTARGREMPFWIRLEYRVQDDDARPGGDEEALSLKKVIDFFSRKSKGRQPARALEAGPFRLSGLTP